MLGLIEWQLLVVVSKKRKRDAIDSPEGTTRGGFKQQWVGVGEAFVSPGWKGGRPRVAYRPTLNWAVTKAYQGGKLVTRIEQK